MSAFVAELLRGDGPVRATGVNAPRDRSWIVGHLRLDGRDDLRDALGAAGTATPKDASDADLALAAWNTWRETATERLIGDYAFAIWDHRERTLFCARDPLGVRPLYWAEAGRTFVCGNVLDDVRAHPLVSPRLHEPAIVSFLTHGYNDDTSTTTFTAVRRLPPAHQLIVRDGFAAIVPRRYWAFPVPEPLVLRREAEYVERFRELVTCAVRDRLRYGRAAILLSGGLDSATLATTARRAAPSVVLSAWTQDMGDSQPADELRLAADVAERIGAVHHVVRNTAVPLAHLAAPGFHTPEPLDEPEWGSWTAQLREISAGAPTLVSGEDGDALFRPPGLATMLRTRPLAEVASSVLKYTVSHRHQPHLGLWLRHGMRSPLKPRRVRVPRWVRRDVRSRAARGYVPSAAGHPVRPDAVRSLGDSIWQSVLEQSQPAYTGVPLEIAWPLLDVRLMEFVFAIPPVPWCQRKELMRRALAGDVPDEVVARPKAPLHGYSEERVARWRADQHGVAPRFGSAIREFVDTHAVTDTLQRGSVWDVLAAWRVLILDRWLQRIERERAS